MGMRLTWRLPGFDLTDETISPRGVVQAVLPGAWAPATNLPSLETAGAIAA